MPRPRSKGLRRYDPDEITPGMVDTARRRTETLLRHLGMFNHNLKAFAASCYLQGIFDAAEAVAHQDRKAQDHQPEYVI